MPCHAAASCLQPGPRRHSCLDDRSPIYNGFQVLAATGVQSETHLPFAGLHQLLRPILTGADDLPPRQRDSLLAAFGMADATVPDFFLIALAVLELAAGAAARSPLLLVAEDAQWLDMATCDVLAFVARRLQSEPIIMIAAIREGFGSVFAQAGMPELAVQRLDEPASRAVLTMWAPDLDTVTSEQVLQQAAGNPLALAELPRALTHWPRSAGPPLPPVVSLTGRLERAFTARLETLPAETCTLLLVAAADDGSEHAEILSAASLICRKELTADAFEPAVCATLVRIDGTSVHFRHPLVRSAIYQAATSPQRRAAHTALTQVLADQPDRRVWHAAAAAAGPDDDVAAELEAMAARLAKRGGIMAAAAALERAAQLTRDPVCRGSRLVQAGELALELGRTDIVIRLVEEASTLDLDEPDAGRVAWLRNTVHPAIRGDSATLTRLVDIADRMNDRGDPDLALKLLWTASTHAWHSDNWQRARKQIVTVCDRLPVPGDNPRLLSTLARAAPIECGALVIDRASRWSPDPAADPSAMHLLGLALSTVGAQPLPEGFFTAAAERMRAEGRLRPLAQVLMLRSVARFLLGQWRAALADATEAAALAAETSQPVWAAAAIAVQAILAGAGGDESRAYALAAEAEQTATSFGTPAALVFVQLARGLTALSAGQHATAFGQLQRLFDPADPAYHSIESGWILGDLAEAARHSGHLDEARAELARAEPLTTRTPAPLLHVAVRQARALLAAQDEAEKFFQAGLQADMTAWPFYRARLQLAYGAWLRRQRRAADSRAPLRAARDTFDTLGAHPWSERARQELRASGETSRRPTPDARDQLTPQELQIAQLAATGLPNREIAQQLYLSHRTVGSHLYRIFPKLGIRSRAELAAILNTQTAPGT